MKTKIRMYLFVLIGILLTFASCSKKAEENITPTPTPEPEIVYDIDGNVYHTIKIGTQTWLAENLQTTRLNNGTLIPLVTDNAVWGNLTTPGYCWYVPSYGALYNWHAVNTGKLAPAGWHVPSDAEWNILTIFLGGEGIAGGTMKEIGIAHWTTPNIGATNSTGFTALPGGLRDGTYDFRELRNAATFWSSSLSQISNGWYRYLTYDKESIGRANGPKTLGLSVRCIKN